jgi:hypothetical protein
LTQTGFPDDMKAILSTISQAYEHPVDIEFTVNFLNETDYRINLLQCRPFQFTGEITQLQPPEHIDPHRLILRSNGPIIGQSMAKRIERIIYIVPEQYGQLPISERYAVARLLGEITNHAEEQRQNVMLIGPGRWGTRMPELGVPVSFSEIKNVAVLCEIAKMHEGLNPDLSLGTHFFNDLVDMNILYMGISPERQNAILNEDLLRQAPNRYPELLPNHLSYSDVVYVIDTEHICADCSVLLHADTLEQHGVVFLSSSAESS